MNDKPEFMLNRTALLDADYIAYEAAAWAHSYQIDAHDLVERVQGTVQLWISRSFCSHALAMFSCSREDNYRRDYYPPYKAHRTGDPPAMLDIARKAIEDEVRSVRIPRLEADDIMGIIATGGKVENPVIVSVDKDMRQIPGWHYNPNKEDFPVLVSDQDADLLFYTQWLTGDSTDGYGGLKGVGPKKAEKLLVGHTLDEMPLVVLEAYHAAGMPLDAALAQARCARILRSVDWDQESKQVIPWDTDLIPPEMREAGGDGKDG